MDDYKGFYKTNRLLSWVLAISLFSLAGIPPTAGFFGKFFLLFAGAGKGNYLLIMIAALNMVVSLYYYLKVLKACSWIQMKTRLKKFTVTGSRKLQWLSVSEVSWLQVLRVGPIIIFIHWLSKNLK